MANEYYERLSEMNPGDLADGLAMEAEFDAISQGFSKLPTPHTGGQGFDGPVRVGDAVNDDEAVNLGQLQAAIGEAVLLPIATYGNLSAAAWGTLPSNTYLLFGTGAQLSNTPYTLVAGSTYYLQVRHAIGGAGVDIYHDQLLLASTDDASNVDLRRLFVRAGSSLAGAISGGWFGVALKKPSLTALESLTPAADRIAYYSGGDTAAMTALTALARTLLASATAAAARGVLDAYGKNNIVGAVSQSGGVPTAAIVERGSNANGEYTKYADGTLICSRVASFDPGSATLANGKYRGSTGFKWTYPSTPTSEMAVAVTVGRLFAEDTTGLLLSAIAAERTSAASARVASSATYYIESTANWAAITAQIQLIAFGRWY